MKYLVVIEVSQKQHYIFKTDRLSQNIGASIAVRKLTEEVPGKYLYKCKGEIVYAGGGNSVYEFDNEEDAKGFISYVSEEALVQYPGAEMFLAMHGYDEENDEIELAINELFSKLEKKKALRESTFSVHSLGITKKCAMTQLPASSYNHRDKEFVSLEAAFKSRLADEETEGSYKDLLPAQDGEREYRFAKRFEELGGTINEKNYVAVVVIDGNRMGKKIKSFRENFAEKYKSLGVKERNIEYKKAFRNLSEGIENIYRTAIRRMMADLIDKLPSLVSEKVISSQAKSEKGEIVLPIRPLIMAGDDICFVTDARLGLYLAEKTLTYIEEQTLDGYDFEFKSCAGVAFTKTSYPFFRSHELAEELCSNAKSVIDPEGADESVIDFHIVQGEIEGDISEIRREKYNDGALTNKPFHLQDRGEKNNLQFFKNRIKQFRQADFGKGALKEYREALKKGEEKSKQYLAYKRLDGDGKIGDSYENGHCTDFDVIEMLDIYFDPDDM